MQPRIVRLCVWIACLNGLWGCGGSGSASDQSNGDTYLAFASSFVGYENWQHAPATPAEGAPQGVHDLGPATAYWNRARASGSNTFAIGTIIVKQTDPGAAAPQTFAMVKRGGDYNSAGARNWEFFELQPAVDGPPLILWRGIGPPNGESYGGDPNTCNTCHSLAAAHDYVWSQVLQSM
jgi:hypothetical protein